MKRHFGLGGILGGSAIALLASQPAWADATVVTDVQVNQTAAGIELVLETENGDRPQIFTINRGNALIADIINTQLRLEEGNGFLQNDPAPGISSIMVTQLDANSVRVTVNGATAAPAGEVQQNGEDIVLSFASASDGIAAQPGPSTPGPTTPPVAQTPPPVETPQPSPPVAQTPEVLVPNPQVAIDGVPAIIPDPSYTPPLQPRAVAPPLGDIAVSNMSNSPIEIDLGTGERVPRLVLRDAPVREVLSLLGRAAGLNVAYVGEDVTQQEEGVGADEAPDEVRISLDIENEPVQNVFNYVLRISGLEANRTGRTIFVGPRLPDDARNIITRSLRLNQADVTDAANFLTAQGAETQLPFESVEVQTVGEGAASRTIEIRRPEIIALRATGGNGPLLLRGLSVLTNDRLNSITLVGAPEKVELASRLLAQLDLRQRQVAINVKIVDINLLATEDFNSSFSFGFDDGFFVTDGGAAAFNLGDTRPPGISDVTNSRLSPPIVPAPFPQGIDLEPFLDAQPEAPFGQGRPQPFGSPPLNDGSIQQGIPGSVFPRPPFGTDNNPLQPGVTDIDDDSVEFSLPQLFRYPTDFLASLEAQIVSGNAKLLTDPTLVIQEGQVANVALTQDVITNITVNRDFTDAGVSETLEFERTPAGLILEIQVQRIDDNGFITLSVNPSVTSPSQSFSTGDGEITLLARRSLETGELRLRDGQTLIVSGIIQESDRTTVSKVPILGDIPILGALFRSTERENTRQEVIVLLTPQIIDDSDLSTFGYRYTPSQDAQQILQRQGL